MSFLTARLAFTARTSLLRQSPARISRPVAAASSFHTTALRNALSESDHGHSDHPDRDAKIDHHKDDSINKAKDGKGEWKQELSSNSEQAIKADRGEIEDAEADIKNLQAETEKIAGKSK